MVRREARLKGRWHNNRHTLITKLAESEADDQTIMEIAGHVSHQMLARYSHIRMEAKREALEGLAVRRRIGAALDSHESHTLARATSAANPESANQKRKAICPISPDRDHDPAISMVHGDVSAVDQIDEISLPGRASWRVRHQEDISSMAPGSNSPT
jgi:hypothetical protein